MAKVRGMSGILSRPDQSMASFDILAALMLMLRCAVNELWV